MVKEVESGYMVILHITEKRMAGENESIMARAGYKKRAYRASRGYRQNMIGMLMIVLIVCVLMGVIVVKSRSLKQTIQANQNTIETLETQIETENERAEAIEKQGEYMKSDEYIAKIAREKLGLVNDDEIMFKESK